MINSYYYSLFIVTAIIIALMVIDPNVGVWIDLQFKLLVVRIRSLYYLILLHPRNPISRWQMERRIEKLTNQLQKEMKEKENGDV